MLKTRMVFYSCYEDYNLASPTMCWYGCEAIIFFKYLLSKDIYLNHAIYAALILAKIILTKKFVQHRVSASFVRSHCGKHAWGPAFFA